MAKRSLTYAEGRNAEEESPWLDCISEGWLLKAQEDLGVSDGMCQLGIVYRWEANRSGWACQYCVADINIGDKYVSWRCKYSNKLKWSCQVCCDNWQHTGSSLITHDATKSEDSLVLPPKKAARKEE
jgi:hypothetical protein